MDIVVVEKNGEKILQPLYDNELVSCVVGDRFTLHKQHGIFDIIRQYVYQWCKDTNKEFLEMYLQEDRIRHGTYVVIDLYCKDMSSSSLYPSERNRMCTGHFFVADTVKSPFSDLKVFVRGALENIVWTTIDKSGIYTGCKSLPVKNITITRDTIKIRDNIIYCSKCAKAVSKKKKNVKK